MTDNPIVASIIIPTYNRSRLLRYTLDSIVEQTIDKSLLEVIIADDGSSDDTERVVRAYAEVLNVKYFFQPDLGRRVSLARNTGIRNASGKVCLFVDTGMMLGQSFVEEHLRTHQLYNEPVTVLGSIYAFDNSNKDGGYLETLIDCGNADATIGCFKERQQFLDPRNPFFVRYADDLTTLPAPWVFFWSCNISVSRQSLHAVGLFDTSYDQNWGMEDIDLGYRLHLAGVKTVYNREAQAIHFPHDKDEQENQHQQESNMAYFCKKYGTPEAELFAKVLWRLNDELAGQNRVFRAAPLF